MAVETPERQPQMGLPCEQVWATIPELSKETDKQFQASKATG